MTALIDYGAGNLRSVHKALKYVGADVRIVTLPEEIGDARALVLPGVGAFDDCINALRKQELLNASLDFIKTGRPFLGSRDGAMITRSPGLKSGSIESPSTVTAKALGSAQKVATRSRWSSGSSS